MFTLIFHVFLKTYVDILIFCISDGIYLSLHVFLQAESFSFFENFTFICIRKKLSFFILLRSSRSKFPVNIQLIFSKKKWGRVTPKKRRKSQISQ